MVPRNALPKSGTLLVLNGTSSAGKTSLARELQRLLPTAYLHVRLDTFREMEPAEYFSQANALFSDIRVAALCRAINATVLEYLRHGQDVILDHVLSPAAWHYLAEDMGEMKMLLISVKCSDEETSRRETSRTNRARGLAASQRVSIHLNRQYDFTVDTTDASPTMCAEQVLEWLKTSPAAHSIQTAGPKAHAG